MTASRDTSRRIGFVYQSRQHLTCAITADNHDDHGYCTGFDIAHLGASVASFLAIDAIKVNSSAANMILLICLTLMHVITLCVVTVNKRRTIRHAQPPILQRRIS